MRQKRILFTAACILAAVGAMAQGNGQAGITEATQMVTSYFEPGTKLIYAIGGGRLDRRGESVREVQLRRPRHVEDGGELVRSLHLPDRGGYHPAFVLPVKQRTMDMEINKGIGRNVEFKGLESQYLFIFCGGLLAVFVVFVILYMAGVNQWVCIGFGVASATLLVWLTFRLNARYGTHGLMKAAARRRHPRYVVNRLKIPRLFIFKHWQE